ncbi:hypothetical protein CMTB2_04022 [Caminibacter mediatlanticus TB-2]|uniref:Uncharacterized protein n=1 Tax=Caminibacter mediatlanticus TB-2 TaxID=391592 RepID=A0AAI9AFX6_9BACT|nr:hypothetical protein CMTB2_04022 [Caminibacter mediatlanticus TB-2]
MATYEYMREYCFWFKIKKET